MKKIEEVKILVIGDIMLDRYICGSVSRISPEFPVPIVDVKDEYTVLGGCGNVINNIASLGAKVRCISRIGRDLAGDDIKNKLSSLNVDSFLLEDPRIPTIHGIRVRTQDRYEPG